VEAGLRRLPARLAAGVHRQLLASRRAQLAQLMSARMARLAAEVAAAERGLQHLSPTRVLERGYSITARRRRSPLRTVSEVRPGRVAGHDLAQDACAGGGGADTAPRPPLT
jgi:exonuclease VII large subunit